jgi:protein gp37
MSDRSRIDWLSGPNGEPGASLNPLGYGCYGPTGCAEKPALCGYCFAKILARRNLRGCELCRQFIPHWHPEALQKLDHWKRPRRVFVESMGDCFGDWVTDEQIDAIFDAMADHPQHTFYVLTKQPQNIMRRLFDRPEATGFIHRRSLPRNVFLGASVDTQARTDATWQPMTDVAQAGWRTFASVEPMLTAINPGDLNWANWVIVGAQTGQGAKKHAPREEWVQAILRDCETNGIPVFVKDSLAHVSTRRDWPKEG